MNKRFNTVIVGGGCLGCASAISLQRRLQQGNQTGDTVCIIEKSLIGAGLTAKHSGIVRAANAVPMAARFAHQAMHHWKHLESLWGIACEYENFGALWIARDTQDASYAKWSALAESLQEQGIEFSSVDRDTAQSICGEAVQLNSDEVFFHEPDALQFKPSMVRRALYRALEKNAIETYENTEVKGFTQAEDGNIASVITSAGNIQCDNVINAAGPWSPYLFKSLGISIPVSSEPVNVVNWMSSVGKLNDKMPIIADYVNLAYFRLWDGEEIHMHQPRRRNVKETARVFSEYPLQNRQADFINEPANQSLGYSDIAIYKSIARRRFKYLNNDVYASGYRSYFDITPDLKFILGRDSVVSNVFHCLGAGQSFKYTPLFGEMMADCIVGEGDYLADIKPFSIARFDTSYMENFWKQVAGDQYSLQAEVATL